MTFLEYWKRKNASLAHHWDCMGFQVQFTNRHKFHFPLFQFSNRLIIIQDEEERPRPEFAAKAPYLEKNPITGVREPAFPKAVRCLSLTTNGCFLSLVAQDCFPIEFKRTRKQFLPASFFFYSSNNAYSSSWCPYWCFHISDCGELPLAVALSCSW